ncbi:MAG: hypothetical protein PHS92_00595 [Candidatus Gracilibacteria bacterium]|nr:hypothetical protein [Candidatus Gracilibacteria bacterium]
MNSDKNNLIEKLLFSIKDNFPEINIMSSRLISEGYDNDILELNEELIFRFPKAEGKNFKIEAFVLSELSEILEINIPNPIFVPYDFSFIGYDKIGGFQLNNEIISNLNGKSRQKIVSQIAAFGIACIILMLFQFLIGICLSIVNRKYFLKNPENS